MQVVLWSHNLKFRITHCDCQYIYCRSYYRCTTQKCGVKKRVERSFQDPSVVVTTYEGQHNHLIPATLRGNAAGMLSTSILASSGGSMDPNFPHEFLSQYFLPSTSNNNISVPSGSTSSVQFQSLAPHQQQQQQQQLQVPDYGLLQDLVSSFAHRQAPWSLSLSLIRALINQIKL